MKCKDLLAALNEYVDGDLDPGVCEAFEAHLADCNPCEVVVDNIRRTITLYKCGEPVELPRELHEHLCRLLRARWNAVFPAGGEPCP
jgi:anti-sigma factor RsiW